MGAYPEITDDLAAFIRAQHVFFVGSAPLDAAGHVNLSPKGLDSFRILGPRQVAYQDFTGSGVETIAHLKENGRLVIMFCAFEGRPKIVRLHGRGEVIEPSHPELASLAARFPPHAATRAVIRMDVTRIASSCGFGVPLMKYEGERTELDEWAAKKGDAGLADYRATKNARSLDGLPGVETAPVPPRKTAT